MANKWAIQNGNWSDGSTWNDGVVPTADDDVEIDNLTVAIDIVSIICKSISFLQNGQLNITYNGDISIISDLIGNSAGVLSINSNSSNNQSTTITGNCKKILYKQNRVGSLTINGNVEDCTMSKQFNGDFTVIIVGNVNKIRELTVAGYGTTLNITGTYDMLELFLPTNININRRLYVTGTVVIHNNIVMTNYAVLTINGTIDLSNYSDSVFPIVGNSTINANIIFPQKDMPESVVLEGYQYGDKIGTLKTYQGTLVEQATVVQQATVIQQATVVNLTEQQLQRVANCATVSTVQKCFEDFKE